MEGKSINAWLVSSTSPVVIFKIFKMDLNKPLPVLPSRGHTKLHPTSLQHQKSNLSNPGMMSDSGSSESDVSLDDYISTEKGVEIWDSYWSPINEMSKSSCLDLTIPPLLQSGFTTGSHHEPKLHTRTESQNLSPKNRNYGSSDLPKLNTSPIPQTNLRRSVAVRNPPPRRASQPNQTRPSYSPFPSIRSSPPHDSWPHKAKPTRPRAQTTPSKFHPPAPSTFSTCTTIQCCSPSPSPSSQGSPLYMSSTSLAPLFPPVPPMDLSSPDKGEGTGTASTSEDVSFFEDDDDEDDQGEEEVSAKAKVMKMLHIRNGSAEAEEEGHTHESKGVSLRRLRKSLGEKVVDANESLKAVFRPRGG